MEEAPVTAATGALGPVIAKLAALLGSEYKLRWRTRRDVKFIRSKLKPVHSILWNIWEREELDEASKELKMEALDLADELDDTIFDFIRTMERSHRNKRLVQTKIKASPFQDFKKLASGVSGRCRSKWKEKKKHFSCLLSCGKLATDDSHPGKPRAYPFVRKDVSVLVGMAGPRDELIEHFVGEYETTPADLQLRMALIYGPAGMGKTTLADLVYEALGFKFDVRAFVSVTPGGNMREVLASILQQVAPNSSIVPLAGSEAATEEEHLSDIISNLLKNKRYIVIIDDIWNWREWEVIMKSLPENNLGSRIVGTTRINAVAEKWHDGPEEFCLLHEMLPTWVYGGVAWVYNIGEESIATKMLDMKADLVTDGFVYEHPIVSMCGGLPLAVHCMLSAVALKREEQLKQGLDAKACDVQGEIEKDVMEKGIQNTPGFEPLVESLQLGYDDLPHHMLKTCLLYCSIYPEGHNFERDDLVKRWISEGLVYIEEEANGYFKELENRGMIQSKDGSDDLRMHPMMRHFLRWKSRHDNFITCSSEITPPYNTCRIRRLCVYNLPSAADSLDWNHIRSLVVYEGFERVPWEKLEGLRVLDLAGTWYRLHDHLKDICGLVRLRHLLGLGLNGDRISELPPEIQGLQCLETLVCGKGFAPLPGFIGNLQQLKTLDVSHPTITELPMEIGALQQLQTLRIRNTHITELPKEIWELQQLRTLDISCTLITVLPREIGELQKLRTLDISSTSIRVLPKEIGELQKLRTLDISETEITMLPKETGKLQHLEHLLMTDTDGLKVPREIGALKELKRLKFHYSTTALPLEVCGALEDLPECIHQALNKSDLMSELAREMISFRNSHLMTANGGLVVSVKQMHIPLWIKEHFNDLEVLDIRICKLDEGGLKILREMPELAELTLRFEVVPREPVVITSEAFAKLRSLTVDSRVPRLTFQEGVMPKLFRLIFEFQFYSGPPNKDPVGINHLRSLTWIEFKCNKEERSPGAS